MSAPVAGRLAFALAAPVVAGVAVAVWAGTAGAATPAAVATGLLAGLALALYLGLRFARRWRQSTAALASAIEGLRAGDLSLRLAPHDEAALGALAQIYNDLAEVLQTERAELRRRELLLNGALEASPAAVVLLGEGDRILFANRAARVLFHDGRRLEGHAFVELCAAAPEPLRAALASAEDAVVTVPLAEGEETFQLHHRNFVLDTRPRRLVQVRRLTVELRRQEVLGWKKAIRVIGHEVRTHLAAIRSLARSAGQFSERAEPLRVAELLADVDDAGAALQRFIDGYGRFARLPEPQRETVELRGFLVHLARAEAFRIEDEVPPIAVAIDPGQMQQVLVNLLKNAREAGSPPEEIAIAARAEGGSFVLAVRDRGCGMDAAALERSLLPFHSTKPEGSGLGLAICREIVEAHGGSLRLATRPGGGLEVSCRLPLAAG
jgi:nitrogen fixation/metabolism regulation signal transduction histidine kinase